MKTESTDIAASTLRNSARMLVTLGHLIAEPLFRFNALRVDGCTETAR